MRDLFYLYASLIGFPLLGYALRQVLPKYAITYAHQFITFVAMPFLIITSISISEFIDDLWLVPMISLITIAIGGIFGLIAIDVSKVNENIRTLLHSSKLIKALDTNVYRRQNIADYSTDHSLKNTREKLLKKNLSKQTSWHLNLQSDFMIATTVSNGGYIAFPIILLMLNNSYPHYFTIAVLCDLCSNMVGIYILLKIIEKNSDRISRNLDSSLDLNIDKIYGHNDYLNQSTGKIIGKTKNLNLSKFLNTLFNDRFKIILGSFLIGTIFSIFIKDDLPNVILQSKSLIIQLYLIAIGMQVSLSKYKFYPSQITSCLAVKMLATPVVIVAILSFLGIDKWLAITILILVAMPPLLLDSQIYKEHGLPVEFQVGCNSTGLIFLGFTLPLWIALHRFALT
jgi:predicted permease